MHNLCALGPEAAKTANELSDTLKTKVDLVLNYLRSHEYNGYVKGFLDPEGAKRFYLTRVGIIRVCSFFT
jgi:hypothetical protein